MQRFPQPASAADEAAAAALPAGAPATTADERYALVFERGLLAYHADPAARAGLRAVTEKLAGHFDPVEVDWAAYQLCEELGLCSCARSPARASGWQLLAVGVPIERPPYCGGYDTCAAVARALERALVLREWRLLAAAVGRLPRGRDGGPRT